MPESLKQRFKAQANRLTENRVALIAVCVTQLSPRLCIVVSEMFFNSGRAQNRMPAAVWLQRAGKGPPVQSTSPLSRQFLQRILLEYNPKNMQPITRQFQVCASSLLPCLAQRYTAGGAVRQSGYQHASMGGSTLGDCNHGLAWVRWWRHNLSRPS